MMPKYLNDTKKFLEQRNEEIMTLFLNLTKEKNVETCTILKSTIVLMLYNEIEGAYSRILMELFDYIVDENIPFSNLHKKIQNVYLEYYCKKIGNSTLRLEEFYNNSDLKKVDYVEVNKYLKLYSGNLDAKQIREISGKLGVSIRKTSNGEKLVYIKQHRNKLAHGESSFMESCRDLSDKELKIMIIQVVDYMNMVITSYDNFMERQLRVS